MIVTQKQQKATRLGRLLAWVSPGKKTLDTRVFSEDQFRIELQKEKSRIDRRSVNSEFSVILLNGFAKTNLADLQPMFERYEERLRITDCVGWCDKRLGILLPETGRKGAEIVAKDLVQISGEHSIKSSAEVLVYPDDDQIARGSMEFQDFQFSEANSSDDDPISTENSHTQFGKISQANREAFFRDTPRMPYWKRTIDIVGSLTGLFILSPVFAAASIAVRLSSPGPIFFRQLREGKDGKQFEMLKFRTMCNDAESLKNNLREFSEQDGPAFKIENDPRLTKVGKYLRKSCIDELPQLLNVLKGEMSLVGPRPLPVSESVECLIWQRKRLEVTPGLTCIWQVRGNRNTKFSDWMRMDMEYINNRSLWLDLNLIVRTVWVALLHRGSV